MKTTTKKTGATVVWGWFSNVLVTEHFDGKSAAWARVQELMTQTIESGTRSVALIEVYAATETGRVRTKFYKYEDGSKFCKWGQWGSVRSLMSGVSCG